MKTLLCIGIIIATGCSQSPVDSWPLECLSGENMSYTGVALAFPTGAATFATDDPYCAYRIDGSEDLYDDIFEAWKLSPYEGDIRPVFVSIEGTTRLARNPSHTPWFQVKAADEISDRFAQEEVRRAFQLRTNRAPPMQRQTTNGDPLQQRIILTD